MEMPSNILLILVGGLMIALRKKFVHGSLEFQRKMFRVQYGEKEINSMQMLTILVGLFFIIVSMLSLFGIELG